MSLMAVFSRLRLADAVARALAVGDSTAACDCEGVPSVAAVPLVGVVVLGAAACWELPPDVAVGLVGAVAAAVLVLPPVEPAVVAAPGAVDVAAEAAVDVCVDAEAATSATCAAEALLVGALAAVLAASAGADALLLVVGVEGVTDCEPDVGEAPPPPPPQPTTRAQDVKRAATAGNANLWGAWGLFTGASSLGVIQLHRNRQCNIVERCRLLSYAEYLDLRHLPVLSREKLKSCALRVAGRLASRRPARLNARGSGPEEGGRRRKVVQRGQYLQLLGGAQPHPPSHGRRHLTHGGGGQESA